MSPAVILQRQQAFFHSGKTRPLDFRRRQLSLLAEALGRHEADLLRALEADLGKSPYQGYSTECGVVQAEIRHALRHLATWAAPARLSTPWIIFPARGWSQPEPLGVALILGPWNYPLLLLLAPLVSALAAGNCSLLKPSELAPQTARTIQTLLEETFPPEQVAVVTGDVAQAEALLLERFDKIFFTGSTRVGRKVMAAAARHLTPVTLELGGKCPAIVCADANIELAARRLAWGKFLNAGQTCVAPDFVLVDRRHYASLIQALQHNLVAFYGEDARHSPDYGRIVNRLHFDRLASYLTQGKVLYGGMHDAEDLFIAPTVLGEVPPEASVMQEEIFGPILPVLPFDRLDDALGSLRHRPTPLALYLFTRDRTTQQAVPTTIRSGGVCLNDVVSHMIGPGLPFGGLGESGLGAYHGRAGFDAFSHRRTIVRRALWFDPPFRYPPQRLTLRGLKRAFRFLLR